MDIRQLILGVLVLSSCEEKEYATGGECNADEDSYDINVDLTAQAVLSYQSTYSATSYNDLSCPELCWTEVREAYSWEVISTDDCTLSFVISEEIDASAADYDPQEVVGSVACSGRMTEYFCMGRRPLGHKELCTNALRTRSNKDSTSGSSNQNYFVQCAHLEAASVDAFVELAHCLRTANAPQNLIDRSVQAAKEEVHHAVLFARLAGIQEIPTCEKQRKKKSIFEMALHNAVEGCIYESWAALMAHHHKKHCSDPRLRSVYKVLAQDETKHAQLSWDLHDWFLSQLSKQECAHVLDAQKRALFELSKRVSQGEEIIPDGVCAPQKRLIAMVDHFVSQVAS